MNKLLLLITLLCVAGCKHDDSQDDTQPIVANQAQLGLFHADAFTCRGLAPNEDSTSYLYCWANSDADVATTASLGITSTTPTILAAPTGGLFSIRITQTNVCFYDVATVTKTCIGPYGTTAGTWAETVNCTVNGNSYHCPNETLDFESL